MAMYVGGLVNGLMAVDLDDREVGMVECEV